MRLRKLSPKDESGQSLVEFALIVPVLLLLLIGIMEFGWLFNGQITLTSAAREGARTAIVDGNVQRAIEDHVEGLSGFVFTYYHEDEDLTEAQAKDLLSGLGDSEVGAVVVKVYDGETFVKEIRVYVSGKIKPFSGLFGTASRQLWADAVMRKE